MIQWGFPQNSLIKVTGLARAERGNLLSPPPRIFAKHDNYKLNLKEITNCWNLGVARQQQCIIQYNNLP